MTTLTNTQYRTHEQGVRRVSLRLAAAVGGLAILFGSGMTALKGGFSADSLRHDKYAAGQLFSELTSGGSSANEDSSQAAAVLPQAAKPSAWQLAQTATQDAGRGDISKAMQEALAVPQGPAETAAVDAVTKIGVSKAAYAVSQGEIADGVALYAQLPPDARAANAATMDVAYADLAESDLIGGGDYKGATEAEGYMTQGTPLDGQVRSIIADGDPGDPTTGRPAGPGLTGADWRNSSQMDTLEVNSGWIPAYDQANAAVFAIGQQAAGQQ